MNIFSLIFALGSISFCAIAEDVQKAHLNENLQIQNEIQAVGTNFDINKEPKSQKTDFPKKNHVKKLKMTCRAKGQELALCRSAIEEWCAKTGHSVEIVTLPHASNECFALYKQWLSAASFDIDILQMDIAWIGIFSEYLQPLDEYYTGNDVLDLDDYFDEIRNSMYYNGRIVALPWYTDCGVIYYRKDLLKKYNRPVPKTLEELYDTAYYIQECERMDPNKKTRFFGFVFQAKAYEVLTCNFAEFVDAFGGKIASDDGVFIASPAVSQSLKFMIKCLKNITSRSVLNYSEEDARSLFQSGNAVFMRNWPYAWSLMNDQTTQVRGKIGVMQIPLSRTILYSSKKTATGVLGGWFLTVSKFSKNPELAASLIKFLTSKMEQRKRAMYSYAPTFKSLYNDREILRINPFFSEFYHSLENAVARPSAVFGRNYTKASNGIFNTVNTILMDSTSGEVVDDLQKHLNRLSKKLHDLLKKKSKPIPPVKSFEEKMIEKQQEIEKKPEFQGNFFSRMMRFLHLEGLCK